MTERSAKLAFPLWRSVSILSGIALILLATAWWAVPMLFGRQANGHYAVVCAAMTVWGSMLIGLLPVVVLCKKDVKAAAYGYFVGAGLRVSICVVATAGSIRLGGLPAGPWVVTLIGMYLPMMFSEVAFVGRYLWRRDSTSFGGDKSVDTPRGANGYGPNGSLEALT